MTTAGTRLPEGRYGRSADERADRRPDAAMGRAACDAATVGRVAEGRVGAGTGASVGKILADFLNLPIPPGLEGKLESGKRGRKDGEGFYRWPVE